MKTNLWKKLMQESTVRRRLLSALLSLCLIVSLLPGSAVAAQPEDATDSLAEEPLTASAEGNSVGWVVESLNYYVQEKPILIYGYTVEEFANSNFATNFDSPMNQDAKASFTNMTPEQLLMKDYTAFIIEHLNRSADTPTVNNADYFVQSIVDGTGKFEDGHSMSNLHAETDHGFIFYIPTAQLTKDNMPQKGDVVHTNFWIYAPNTVLGSYNPQGQGTLSFIDCPVENSVLQTVEGTHLNATVKMFDYPSDINTQAGVNEFYFWNGDYGRGAAFESVDSWGSELITVSGEEVFANPNTGGNISEDAYHGYNRDPVMHPYLSEKGYPVILDKTPGKNNAQLPLNVFFDGTYLVGEMSGGGGLFQKDEKGYYYYDSLQNAAWFNGTDFTLYKNLIVRPWADAGDASDESYGNFLPLNQPTASNITRDGYVFNYERTEIVNYDHKPQGSLEAEGMSETAANKVLGPSNNRLRQEIITDNASTVFDESSRITARLEEKTNLWFGMTVEFDFYQPYGGVIDTSEDGIANPEDMIFDFHGDDDVMVYVGLWDETQNEYNYKLVLDISGVHAARSGNINFKTGAVSYNKSDEILNTSLKDIFDLEGATFADYSRLSIKFFYMERGGNISYCRLRFNMPTLPQNSLTVKKQVTASDNSTFKDHVLNAKSYQFRVVKADESGKPTEELLIPQGTTYSIIHDTKKASSTGVVGENGIFTLRAGQSAQFSDLIALTQNGTVEYVVQEVIPIRELEQYAEVGYTINGVSGTVVGETGTAYITYSTSVMDGNSTQLVVFRNKADVQKLGRLSVTKVAAPLADLVDGEAYRIFVRVGDSSENLAKLPVGTGYTIDGVAYTVQEEGCIPLKVGQTAVLDDAFLAGTTFMVAEEVPEGSDYMPLYSGTLTVGDTVTDIAAGDDSISGTLATGGLVQVTVINGPRDTGLEVDKTVTATEDPHEFVLTLEAYATGQEITVTRPADIVLVLDHSGSMRTPTGAPEVLKSGTLYTGAGAMDYTQLDKTLGQHTGYYVAQSQSSKTWFVVRYDATEDKWYIYSVPNTEAIVNLSGWTEHTQTQSWTTTDIATGSNGSGAFRALNFYKSQYGALYDSVNSFVSGLKATGVEHRVAIIGFAGSQTNGSCVYVGGDETATKKYTEMYHVNTTDARRNALYQKALKNVQSDEEYTLLLSSINAIETNYSYTCPSAGLKMASDLLAANEIDLSQRDRIVVLFTDGIPNTLIGEEKSTDLTDAKALQIYNQIVSMAYSSKQQGAKVYSISTTTLGEGADRTFLNYASSNYPNATNYATPGQIAEAAEYTNEVSTSDALGNIFKHITEETTATLVEVDETAILREVLSDYFDLDNLDGREIKVYSAAYKGSGSYASDSNYEARQELTGVTVTVSPEEGRKTTIEVTGFDYQTEYLSIKKRQVNGEPYYGSKLIVEIPVRTREGFWGGNNVPTNQDTTAVYTPSDGVTPEKAVEFFPIPEANVPIDVTVDVVDKTIYYGGSLDSDVDGKEGEELIHQVTIGGQEVEVNEDGSFTPAEDWMDDFAQASWDTDSTTPGSDLSNTEPQDYTYTVVVAPNSDGMTHQSPNPSNIAGNVDGGSVDPEDLTAAPESAEDTGHVFVKVPQITFQDSVTDYGTPTEGYDYEDKDYVDTSWVFMEDDKDTTTAPEVTGEAPELDLHYTPSTENAPNGSFVTDTKVEVTVTMNDSDITDIVNFGWHDNCTSEDHTETMDVPVHMGNENSNEFWVHVTIVILPDTVVVDFGHSIDINVLANDKLGSAAKVVAFGLVPADLAATSQLIEDFQNTYSSGYGSAKISEAGDKVIYTPANMQMDGADVFAYAVEYTKNGQTSYYYGTITVVPATVIYYEDSFVTFSEGWEPTGDSHTGNQGQDRPGQFAYPNYDTNNIYGYDPAYNESTTYSYGSSRFIHVTENSYDSTTGTWPAAQFTFTGTGFDLISLTSNTTGFITCKVYKGTQPTGDAAKSWVVDTYYGYTRKENETYPWIKETWTYTGERWSVATEAVAEEGEPVKNVHDPLQQDDQMILYKENYEWTPADPETPNDLYQIPVIKSPALEYGTYTVIITPIYIPFFDHTNKEEGEAPGYDFYLDAVRIYNPAKDMESYYRQDGEAWPQFIELRQQLLSVDASGNATGYVDGVSFIDSVATNGTISDYKAYGPNNEIYLNGGQAIAFAINNQGQKIANVHVGVKTFQGEGKLSVKTVNNSGSELYTGEITTKSHTDLYYSITDAYKLDSGEDVSNVIILRNAGTEPITLTTLKITYDSETAIVADNQAKLVMSAAQMKAAEAKIQHSMAPSIPATRPLNVHIAHSVSFESDLQLNYRIKQEDLAGYDLNSAYLVVEKDVYPSRGEPSVETYVLYPDLTSDPQRMIFHLAGIKSVEMGSELRATLHIHDELGRKYETAVDVYSILAYAQACFNKYSYEEYPAFYSLLIDTLNYGAAAQSYFGRRTDSLVNAGLDAYQQYATKDFAEELTATKVMLDNANKGLVSKVNFSIDFADRTAMKVKLTLSGSAEEITSVQVTDEEGNIVASLTEFETLADGRIQVTYDGIRAMEMRRMYYFTAYSGEEAASATAGYSVEAYVRSNLGTSLPGLSDLVRYCMYYGDSAENYFTQRGGESK